MSDHCMIPIVKSLTDYRAYRISPEDKNRLAIIFDPDSANASLTVCVEIFDVGSTIPFHQHHRAIEMFFILKGEGQANCDGKTITLLAGDSILMPPTGIHTITNIGSSRLYVLCIMVPNEDFVELIRNGIPAELDAEDLKVLRRTDSLIPC